MEDAAGVELVSAERQFEADTRNASVPAMDVTAQDPNRAVRVFVKLRPVPSFIGKPMRDVMTAAMENGLEVQIYGRGIARTQIPSAGTEIPEGQPVRVLFTP
jgi:hypothetical protein